MSSLDERELARYVEDYETRRIFIRNHLKELIALQIKMMRKEKRWSQKKLGEQAGMKQPRIALLEDPDRTNGESITTLLRIADAFDVGLIVSYVPISENIKWATTLSPQRLSPPSYEREQQQIHDRAANNHFDGTIIQFEQILNASTGLMKESKQDKELGQDSDSQKTLRSISI